MTFCQPNQVLRFFVLILRLCKLYSGQKTEDMLILPREDVSKIFQILNKTNFSKVASPPFWRSFEDNFEENFPSLDVWCGLDYKYQSIISVL